MFTYSYMAHCMKGNKNKNKHFKELYFIKRKLIIKNHHKKIFMCIFTLNETKTVV